MTIEERRRELRLFAPSWGDLPPKIPHHAGGAGTREHWPHSVQFNLECTSMLDAAIPSDMETSVEYISPPSKLPISTADWTLSSIVESSQTFLPVPRISCKNSNLQMEIERYETTGVPFIIEGWHDHKNWPKQLFNIDSFTKDVKIINVRNVHDFSDKNIETMDFIARCRASPLNTFPEERERLYGKDAECPAKWVEWLQKKVIPPSLLHDAPTNLLGHLPRSSSVETLMCYLGIGDTFTPCHKDLCASSGQNLMCYTENGGSSFWFMTKGSDAPKVSEYFHTLNQELDHETHVVTIEQLAKAPFDVYIAEQKLGDLVLVPPRSCHQVVNHGGITIKTSWSRMTLNGLVTAYYHELPIYRRVCRPEIYQVKGTVYHTILRYIDIMKDRPVQGLSKKADLSAVGHRLRVAMAMKQLLQLFDDILVEEYSPDYPEISCLSSSQSHAPSPSPSPTPSNSSLETLVHVGDVSGDLDYHVVCDFCGADIFQSFFECGRCVEPNTSEGSGVDERGGSCVVCAACYVEGRSCQCKSMDAMQLQPFENLLDLRSKAFRALHEFTQDHSFLLALKQKPYVTTKTGVFRAARMLERTRKHKRDTKVCTSTRSRDCSHTVPFSWALSCKKCHGATCFVHLLDWRIHSADAILHQTSDGSHENFHNHHLTSRSVYRDAAGAFLKSQEEGVRPDSAYHRVHAALVYRTCRPATPNPSLMQAGWYDRVMQITSTSFDLRNRNHDFCESAFSTDMSVSPPAASPPPPPNPVQHPPASVVLSEVSTSKDHGTSNTTSLKRKRCVMNFVLVPPAPYTIKCRSSNPQPRSTASNPAVVNVSTPVKPSTSDAKRNLLEEKCNSKETPPIPRHKPSMTKPALPSQAAQLVTTSTRSTVVKSPHLGNASHTQSSGSPKRKARILDAQAATMNGPPSLPELERNSISRTHKGSVIRKLKFHKKRTSGVQKSSNHSSSSSTSRYSPTMSNTATDGGPEFARVFNHAVIDNQRSSADADVVMDAPTMATEHAGPTEALFSEIRALKEKVESLSQAMRAPPHGPAPPGTGAHNFFHDRNQSQPMIYWLALPHPDPYWQGQYASQDGWWPQDKYYHSQAQHGQHPNQGSFYGYNGGPAPGAPVRPRFNPHRFQPRQGQYPRHDGYHQRSDHHHYQSSPNRRQQPYSQGYHWGARRAVEGPQGQDNQKRPNLPLPAGLLSYHQGVGQPDHAQFLPGRISLIREGSPSGQAAQIEESARPQSIRAASPDARPPSMHTAADNGEQTQENNTQTSAAQWEDGYELEDPVTPEERTFKLFANYPLRPDKDFTDLTNNPWQSE